MLYSGKFQKYDHGYEGNLQYYGQGTPPEVSLKPIRDNDVPIALFVGREDTIVYPEDSKWTKG